MVRLKLNKDEALSRGSGYLVSSSPVGAQIYQSSGLSWSRSNRLEPPPLHSWAQTSSSLILRRRMSNDWFFFTDTFPIFGEKKWRRRREDKLVGWKKSTHPPSSPHFHRKTIGTVTKCTSFKSVELKIVLRLGGQVGKVKLDCLKHGLML